MTGFRALLVEKTDTGYGRQLVEREIDDLPEGDVLIDVRYSSTPLPASQDAFH